MKNNAVQIGYKNFNHDLARSNKAEQEIVAVLADLCGESLCDIVWNEGKKEYDIRLTTLFSQCTIEIKCDYSHAKYGNIAVEYWCRDKPSGILASKADYWIYRIYERDGSSGVYLMKRTDLLLMINGHMYKDRKEDVGDKNSGTCIFLFDGKRFKECSKLIHTFGPEKKK